MKTTKTKAAPAKASAPAKAAAKASAPAKAVAGKPAIKPVAKGSLAKVLAERAERPQPPKVLKSTMSKKELEPYRDILQDLKQKLIRDVLLNQEASNESIDGEVLDLADQASDAWDKDLANSLSETERMRLNAVEDALRRVEEGSYGVCQACAKPIPLARLKALPFAKLCVQCQQEEERTGRAQLPAD